MTTNEQLTPTAPSAASSIEGAGGRVEQARSLRSQSRFSPTRSLVLPQSWVAFSGLRRGQPSLRLSTLQAAEAFSLLSSELATRRGGAERSNA